MNRCNDCGKRLWPWTMHVNGRRNKCFDCGIVEGYSQIAKMARAHGGKKSEHEVWNAFHDSVNRIYGRETKAEQELKKIRKILEKESE